MTAFADAVDAFIDPARLDTGPRTAPCPTCLNETVHHFVDDELLEPFLQPGEGWWRCEACGSHVTLNAIASTPEDAA
jgi:hypothetical protein